MAQRKRPTGGLSLAVSVIRVGEHHDADLNNAGF